MNTQTESQNKTVIITGANGNLGTAVTNHLLNKGYTVIATVINEEAKKDFSPHKSLEVQVVNLANEEEANSFVQNAIDRYKTIDGALLLVGGFAMGSITDTKSEDIKKQIQLNFDTAYHVARPLYQHMLQNNYGRIVFIGSRPALKPVDGRKMVSYALSKSLLFHLAEFINEDAKGKNITATVVVPSTLDTPANRKSMPNANPDNWVKTESLAEILEFVISEKGQPLREPVLKVYNNA
jgi:NAD(P)-dependent dehydrogenase (short-subunit alcohol dehydrogenase family)